MEESLVVYNAEFDEIIVITASVAYLACTSAVVYKLNQVVILGVL